MSKSIPLEVGQKFNRLTIIKLDHIEKYISPKGKKKNKVYYVCQCDCGKNLIVLKNEITSNGTKSCGCKREENIRKSITIHNMTKTRLYKIWRNIKTRCLNKNNKHYKDYGGRGITICEDWKNDFMSFYNWAITNGYKEDLTIDRIDVNGNYEPSNCRWADRTIQNKNKRNNHLITYNGETHCVAEWSGILEINLRTLWSRIINYNWPIEKIFETPVRKRINKFKE